MDGWNNKNEEKYVFHWNSTSSSKVKVKKARDFKSRAFVLILFFLS